jgi:ankyrin repeat protein
MSFYISITTGDDVIKFERHQLTEEEKIEKIVRMFKTKNMSYNLGRRDFLNDVKKKIMGLSNVNLFVKSAELQYNLNLLFHASRENFPEIIDFLLERGADPTLINNKGMSVLHLMAKRGQVEMAKKCFYKVPWNEKDDFINESPESGWTPLMAAAENNQLHFAKWLLSERNHEKVNNHTKVNKKMKTGWTAMHAAAKKNNADMVKLLLIHGGDKDICANHKDFGIFVKVKDVTKDPKVLKILDEYD